MNWLFGGKGGSFDRDEALRLVTHLQRMYAGQQLTMEIVNDALALAAQVAMPVNEGLVRPVLPIRDVQAVEEQVLPALAAKAQILEGMASSHAVLPRPTHPALREAYDDFTAALAIARQRGDEQFRGFSAWAEDPALDVDSYVSQSDSSEAAAMSRSVGSLNVVIEKLGLSADAWLLVNRTAFNDVRTGWGLAPLSEDEFRTRYLSGLAGQPARFFTD